MSDHETRADLFNALQSLAEVATEMRAGRLMAAVGELCADIHGRGLWDASDAKYSKPFGNSIATSSRRWPV